MDDELVALVSSATTALGRLDGSIRILPDADLFVLMYVRKEAVYSSQIEGTQSSLDDLLEAEAQVYRPGKPKDVVEVVNYVNALKYGLERLETLPVSVRLVCEIHERLLEGVRGADRQPGEIRRSQNWIGPGGCSLSEAVFVPPPPYYVPEALSRWERFLHEKTERYMPELIKIGLAHAQFETIHPFLDGNGRLGRLLITLLLCERGVLHKPVLYLSHYFKRYRELYYDRLQAIRDEGDWEGWIKFFLRAVEAVAEEATETARKIVDLRERHRKLVVDVFGGMAGKGLKVLEYLFSHPLLDVNTVAGLTGSSFPSANQLVKRLEEAGILVEFTGRRRNRVFRYSEYIGIFAD